MNYINTLGYIYNSKLIVSGSRDNSIKIWNYESGECVNTLIGHRKKVKYICTIKDTKYIVSCSKDRTIKLWDY